MSARAKQRTTRGHGSPVTPAMRQYADQKAQVGDAILFFRMGDFYETFYEDAKIAARVLGLALTSRSKGAGAIPLAGVPFHAVDSYISRLVQAGYKVAISEQVEDPKLAKGVVKRKIVRIITPGTLTDAGLLNDQEDNYLACCVLAGPAAGLAWVDLSTGEFRAMATPSSEVIDELVRIRPAELIVPELDIQQGQPGHPTSPGYRQVIRQIDEAIGCQVTYRPGWWFDHTQVSDSLCSQFGVTGLDGFGFTELDESVSAAGGIVQYLSETQKTTLEHLRTLVPVNRSRYLQLDQTTVRSLELERTIRTGARDGTLVAVMDHTCTAAGSRQLRQWLLYPLKDLDEIVLRQDAVDMFLQRPDVIRTVRTTLKEFADLERIISRVGTARASPRDLAGLARTIADLPGLVEQIEPISIAGSLIQNIAGDLVGLDDLSQLLCSALAEHLPATIRDGGVIADGFDEELDRLRGISRDGQTWLARFQAGEVTRTGISTLKVGYNQVFGYYIEVTHAQTDRVPDDYVRRQTLKNAERYVTDELRKYEQEQLTARQRALDLEARVFERLRAAVAEQIEQVQRAAHAAARLDVIGAFAYAASMRGYCRPELVTKPVLKIVHGRHPVLDVTLAEKFVPNDADMVPEKANMMIITGPNMAGKSTYIRQVALLTLLAHTGSYIPAKQATIGLCDRIFTRVGASDELTRGQSTFMVEMTEAANIVNNATDRSLIIFDELGRGTSTYDGLALAWAISEHITRTIKARTLFATHYHELTELEHLLEGVKNLNILVREWHDQIIFLHRITAGGTDKSYGIHVARLAGLPREVITRAGIILGELERGFSREVKSSELTGSHAAPDRELFDHPAMTVLEDLKGTKLDTVTPLQAIQILKEFQDRLAGG